MQENLDKNSLGNKLCENKLFLDKNFKTSKTCLHTM